MDLKSDKTLNVRIPPKPLVASLEIGTTYSCCAFSFKFDFDRNPLQILTRTRDCHNLSSKEPTVVLFDPSKGFHSFGYEAEKKYADLVADGEHKDWYFFAGFKTMLQKATRETEIKDKHSKTMKAEAVLTAVIKYLKDNLVDLLVKRNTGLDNRDICWILTVPAIWTASARQLMSECALGAGINRHQLLLLSEPEAASWFFRIPSTDKSTIFHNKYILVNLGDRKMDVTAFNKTESGWKDIHTSAWDENTCFGGFFQMLNKIVGAPVMQRFMEEERKDYINLQRELEKILRSVNDSSEGVITLNVPPVIGEMYELEFCESIKQAVEYSNFAGKVKWRVDKMRIDKEVFSKCFFLYIRDVVRHLQEVLRDPQVFGTELVILVGGISESKLIVGAIKKQFPKMRVYAPDDSWLTVAKGAVIYGHLSSQSNLNSNLYLPDNLAQTAASKPATGSGAVNLRDNKTSVTPSPSDVGIVPSDVDILFSDMAAQLYQISREHVEHFEQLHQLDLQQGKTVQGLNVQVDKLLKERKRFEEETNSMIQSLQRSMTEETTGANDTIQKLMKEQKLLRYRTEEMKMQFERSLLLLKKRESQQMDKYKRDVMKYEERVRDLEKQCISDAENISALTITISSLQDEQKRVTEILKQTTLEKKKSEENVSFYTNQLGYMRSLYEKEKLELLKTIDNQRVNINILSEKIVFQEKTIDSEKRKAEENLRNILHERDQRIEDMMRRNEYLRGILKEKDAMILNLEEQTSHNKTFHDLRVQQMEVKLKLYASEEVKYKKQIKDIEEQHLVQIESMKQQLDASSKMKETMDKREESMLRNIEILKGMIALEKRKGVQKDAEEMGDRQSEGATLITTDELSDPNRATGLSERYKLVYKEEWSSAFEALTDGDDTKCLKQKQAATLLLDMLKECVAFCDKTSKRHMENLTNILLHPLRSGPADGVSAKGDNKDNATASSILDISLRELRRKMAVQQGVIEEVKQAFLDEAKSWDKSKKGFDPAHVKTCTPYLVKCVELCWMMVLQDPQLLIKFDFKDGEKFDPSVYTMYSASGDKIYYIVWPPLFNGEHGELLAKGVVELI